MRIRNLTLAAVLATTTLFGAPVNATTFTDPLGDFLGTFTGPQNGDLDVLSGSADFNAVDLLLSSTMNGAIGTTTGSLFVWGINRGAGTDRLITAGPPAVGAPDILMDAVVALNADGTGRVVTFPTMGAPVTTVLDPSLISISGDTISGRIPRSLLPTTGFAFDDYTYINWSRSAFGSQAFIADLAPDAGPFTATFVPEPATWALLVAGFGLTGALLRRQRQTAWT
jgi:hypothetical protein